MKKQILTIKKFFLFLTLSALVSPLLLADQREENINLFLVLDKSLSMAEEIGEVKRYVNDFLFDAFLIPGDRVAIIPFYGKTELLFSGIVEDYNAKDPLRKMVEAMTADGRYTDIGNALDRLKLTLEEEPPRELHNYLLLITDGIQEAPPESPYYSSDGSFNHRFLENTKTIRKQGWKIQILGIGQKSAAKDVAEELSGAYAEISDDEITAEKIDEAASQIYGMIRPLSEPVLSPADASGAAYFTMNLESTGYTTDKTVKIYGVRFETAEGGSHQVLDISRGSFFSITLSPNEEKTLALPLSFSEIPESEPLKGSLALNFSSEVPITPAVFSVTLEKSPPGIFLAVPLFPFPHDFCCRGGPHRTYSSWTTLFKGKKRFFPSFQYPLLRSRRSSPVKMGCQPIIGGAFFLEER